MPKGKKKGGAKPEKKTEEPSTEQETNKNEEMNKIMTALQTMDLLLEQFHHAHCLILNLFMVLLPSSLFCLHANLWARSLDWHGKGASIDVEC